MSVEVGRWPTKVCVMWPSGIDWCIQIRDTSFHIVAEVLCKVDIGEAWWLINVLQASTMFFNYSCAENAQ